MPRGGRPGPRAAAFPSAALVHPLHLRLAGLSSLARMRGTPVLADLDAAARGPGALPAAAHGADGSVSLAPSASPAAERLAYWTVLRLCARLGMIAGRGVPPAPGAMDAATPPG